MVFYTLALQFYFKNGEKKEGNTFLRKKNRRKMKQCYHNDISRLKRDNFSSEVEITRKII